MRVALKILLHRLLPRRGTNTVRQIDDTFIFSWVKYYFPENANNFVENAYNLFSQEFINKTNFENFPNSLLCNKSHEITIQIN